MIDIACFTSGDDVFVHWRSDATIKDCLGFALYRRRNGKTVCLDNYIGFSGDAAKAPQPSGVWPLQRYRWVDHLVDAGDEVSYRVVARLKNGANLVDGPKSAWSAKLAVGPGAPIGVYFNRGIVASQWVSRLLGGGDPTVLNQKLTKAIATAGNPVRDALSGYARTRMLTLLGDAKAAGHDVYACIYELNDPELVAALIALGQRAHVVLSNGSKKRIAHSTPARFTDGNKASRAQLSGKVDLHDRLVVDEHLCHHKFLVTCDGTKPISVWTGSTNWSQTGLCTQANNGLLIEDPDIAAAFLEQWKRLKQAGNDYPASLLTADDTPTTKKVGGADVTVYFAPTTDGRDLDAARTLLKAAQQGVLFLMFNPGPKNTLLNTILELQQQTAPELYIRGVVNQDPGGTKAPVLRYGPEKSGVPLGRDIVLPAAIETSFDSWIPELRKLATGFAMVHSKVVVIDPFGAKPVLITGSHNLGPKASASNDDNLVIIEGDAAAAQAHACVIMTVYDTYHWREYVQLSAATNKPNRGTHLVKGASWQQRYADADGKREIGFWFGG
jgi:phosphatidylserine/phosphatidylglycerophosphate/cardiolipin synthase-like enzyme